MNRQLQSSPFSKQTAGTNQQLYFNPEETSRLANWSEVRLQKWQAATGTLRAPLGWVSLNGSIITNWAQQRYVRWINECVSLAKNSKVEETKPRLSGHLPLPVRSYLYSFIKSPFTCLLYPNTFHQCVWFRKTFFHSFCFIKTSCVPQKNHHLT
jgi:hypothetical protein